MVHQQDTLIIGGGVIGVCAAYYLAGKGQSVTLVEKGEIAAGCSYGNAGLIVPSHSIPLATPGALSSGLKWLRNPESPFYVKPRLDYDLAAWLLRFSLNCREGRMRHAIPVLRDLGLASRALYDELAAIDGLAFDYARKGVLQVFRTLDAFAEAQEEVHLLQAHGVPVQVLDAAQVREVEPRLRSEMAGGVYFPDDVHLNPAKFVCGLAGVAARMGVQVHTGTEVLSFETSGRKIVTVKTTRGDFTPAQVVLAAGSWSPGLSRELRLKLPIQPAKGYSITVKRPSSSPTVPLMLGEARVAVTPMGDLLRFAGTLELAGFDFSINQRRVNAIRRAVDEYLSGLEDLELVEIWRGWRPCTPDGLPILGYAPAWDNLVIASGHAMVGMSLGPMSGKLAAQLVCGEEPELDLYPLRAGRFSS